ncbi:MULTISPECIES: rhamnogalacturonan acetylesterase [unclassified Microbacterium]|uniref:rhamnogalacturonan acetylesterase n=1 Tax=unclassified Microbacterium TaxID=2609290 RepID=UPI00214A9E55|nr:MULTISPECIES: rhamnogalacturonan acetylesterase [unclassified Microbacterium]MCR2783470.1 rhamnogalacturonan acetylesterase [Microbacterium sp. zg.B96]MDL5351743.1 rhamnogalacturonan acetylesterase [Microbacterium sp. zg-YB36]WIM15667.1 rhamnogalacturonan acetylesterase [Microbacterium sp. zg-B96]
MIYHLAGDSTVAPMKPGEEPLAGWGEALGAVMAARVRNLAFGGATTQSFIASGAWRALVAEVAAGDTVVIQFGHNDQKDAELASRGGYTERLRGFVTEVRALDATAVLCTPCERRWFDEAGRVTPTHGDYPNAVRDLAVELGAPLIDLTAFTTWLYEDLGAAASTRLLSHYAPGETAAWPEGLTDDTHFRVEGARRIAAFVARSLRAIERRDGDRPARGSQLVS